jgi:hypothetical protein
VPGGGQWGASGTWKGGAAPDLASSAPRAGKWLFPPVLPRPACRFIIHRAALQVQRVRAHPTGTERSPTELSFGPTSPAAVGGQASQGSWFALPLARLRSQLRTAMEEAVGQGRWCQGQGAVALMPWPLDDGCCWPHPGFATPLPLSGRGELGGVCEVAFTLTLSQGLRGERGNRGEGNYLAATSRFDLAPAPQLLGGEQLCLCCGARIIR